jgi:hypothetical protein
MEAVSIMSDPTLILRRANLSRKGGEWDDTDYDVFDGERCVGRIFLQASGAWFWGVDFQLTGCSNYGHVATLDEAKAAFRAFGGERRASIAAHGTCRIHIRDLGTSPASSRKGIACALRRQ